MKALSKVISKVQPKANDLPLSDSSGGSDPHGPELLTNGEFTTDLSSWTVTSMIWRAGQAIVRNTSNSGIAQTVAMVAGEEVQLIFQHDISAGATLFIKTGPVNQEAIIGPSRGFYIGNLVSEGDTLSLAVTGGTFDVDLIDNVSLKKVLI